MPQNSKNLGFATDENVKQARDLLNDIADFELVAREVECLASSRESQVGVLVVDDDLPALTEMTDYTKAQY